MMLASGIGSGGARMLEEGGEKAEFCRKEESEERGGRKGGREGRGRSGEGDTGKL